MCFVVIEPLVFISGEFEFINLSPDVSVVQLGGPGQTGGMLGDAADCIPVGISCFG